MIFDFAEKVIKVDNNITYEFISDYIKETVMPEDSFLLEMETYARENHIPVIQREAGRLLGFLTAYSHAEKILEIGTAIGYSALLMYNASGKEAHITTIERDEEMFLNARINFKKYGAKQNIKTIFGDAAFELDKINDCFDLVFIDAAKGQSAVFFEKCLEKVHKDSLIITDNVLYGGMTASDEIAIKKHKTITLKMRDFLEKICRSARFDTAIVPIGDGMALTRIK